MRVFEIDSPDELKKCICAMPEEELRRKAALLVKVWRSQIAAGKKAAVSCTVEVDSHTAHMTIVTGSRTFLKEFINKRKFYEVRRKDNAESGDVEKNVGGDKAE